MMTIFSVASSTGVVKYFHAKRTNELEYELDTEAGVPTSTVENMCARAHVGSEITEMHRGRKRGKSPAQ